MHLESVLILSPLCPIICFYSFFLSWWVQFSSFTCLYSDTFHVHNTVKSPLSYHIIS